MKNKIIRNVYKIIIFMVVWATMIFLSSCNYAPVDLTWGYDYAIISLPNGEIVEGEVEEWRDYEGEQLQVVIDGETYLVSSYNCVLVEKD